jgi:hypothetical protein
MVKDVYTFNSSTVSPERFIELFEQYYGPTMNAYEAAQNSGKVQDLHSQLVDLANSQNKGTNGATSIPATFLRVTVFL